MSESIFTTVCLFYFLFLVTRKVEKSYGHGKEGFRTENEHQDDEGESDESMLDVNKIYGFLFQLLEE